MGKKTPGLILGVLLIILSACTNDNNLEEVDTRDYEIPESITQPYREIHGNQPFFTEKEKKASVFEEYAPLDTLGRCGAAYACVGVETMPNDEKREDLLPITPSGWENNTYDFIDQKWLYNRCHLIGFQLTAENRNERNLITGTRYLNIEGMLPFENQTSRYVRETGNHVLYRVTPVFEGENLVANGVLMEGWSIEDQGAGICFCVFVYNVQPGVEIDYHSGENHMDPNGTQYHLIGSAIWKIYHKPSCILSHFVLVKVFFNTTKEAKIAGFQPCNLCS